MKPTTDLKQPSMFNDGQNICSSSTKYTRKRKPNFSEVEKKIMVKVVMSITNNSVKNNLEASYIKVEPELWDPICKEFNHKAQKKMEMNDLEHIERNTIELKNYWKNFRKSFLRTRENHEPVENHISVEPDPIENEQYSESEKSESDQAERTPQINKKCYSVKQPDHCSSVLHILWEDEASCDVSISAQGRILKAHRIILSTTSTYFKGVLSVDSGTKTVVVFKDVKFEVLECIIKFIYKGEVNVPIVLWDELLEATKLLEVGNLLKILNSSLSPVPSLCMTTTNKRKLSDTPCKHKKKSRVQQPIKIELSSSNDDEYPEDRWTVEKLNRLFEIGKQKNLSNGSKVTPPVSGLTDEQKISVPVREKSNTHRIFAETPKRGHLSNSDKSLDSLPDLENVREYDVRPRCNDLKNHILKSKEPMVARSDKVTKNRYKSQVGSID